MRTTGACGRPGACGLPGACGRPCAGAPKEGTGPARARRSLSALDSTPVRPRGVISARSRSSGLLGSQGRACARACLGCPDLPTPSRKGGPRVPGPRQPAATPPARAYSHSRCGTQLRTINTPRGRAARTSLVCWITNLP